MDNVILTEAFKELKLLEEEAFDINSTEDMEDAKEFIEDDIDVEPVIEIADVYADEENELLDSYVGKVILECEVCHSKIFEDADKVTIDEEENVANMDEECPYCFSNDGYKVIGQVAPFGQVEEEITVAEEEPVEDVVEDDVVEDDIEAEVPEEEVTEDEIVEESLNECDGMNKGDCKNDTLDECGDLEECGESCAKEKDELDEGDMDLDDTFAIRDPENPDRAIRVRKNPKTGKIEKAKYGKDGKVFFDELEEDFKDVSITTDDSHMTMTSDDEGKVTVTTEPIHDEFIEDEVIEDEVGDEMIAPVDDETVAEIEGEEEVEEPLLGDDENVDIDIDEFDEEGFDGLGESYLKKVYENVNSFKTTSIREEKNKLYVEGLIGFDSGNKKKTSFIFEAKDIDSKGKIRFIGENKEITRGKKSFTVAGRMDGKKFMCESFNYNYRAKDENGKSTRLYGTIKK